MLNSNSITNVFSKEVNYKIKSTIIELVYKKMLKKEKAVVSFINNHLSSHWKEAKDIASGKGREGDLCSFMLLVYY